MNTKFSKGLRYTGVGGVMCGRLEMIMPLGIGNLQKGEWCVFTETCVASRTNVLPQILQHGLHFRARHLHVHPVLLRYRPHPYQLRHRLPMVHPPL